MGTWDEQQQEGGSAEARPGLEQAQVWAVTVIPHPTPCGPGQASIHAKKEPWLWKGSWENAPVSLTCGRNQHSGPATLRPHPYADPGAGGLEPVSGILATSSLVSLSYLLEGCMPACVCSSYDCVSSLTQRVTESSRLMVEDLIPAQLWKKHRPWPKGWHSPHPRNSPELWGQKGASLVGLCWP